jgi:hypothetical protein
MEVLPESPADSPAEDVRPGSADGPEPTAAAEIRIVLQPAGRTLLLPVLIVEVALNAAAGSAGWSR